MENRITIRRIDVPEVPIIWNQKQEVTTYSIAKESYDLVNAVKANPQKAESTAKTVVGFGIAMIGIGATIWLLAQYFK